MGPSSKSENRVYSGLMTFRYLPTARTCTSGEAEDMLRPILDAIAIQILQHRAAGSTTDDLVTVLTPLLGVEKALAATQSVYNSLRTLRGRPGDVLRDIYGFETWGESGIRRKPVTAQDVASIRGVSEQAVYQALRQGIEKVAFRVRTAVVGQQPYAEGFPRFACEPSEAAVPENILKGVLAT
jgi:hypothetical protein